MNEVIDVHKLLAERKQIAAVWSTEDIQEVRPDLSEDQAWEVLQRIERQHDCNHGISWDTILIVAENMFPESDVA